MKNIGLVLMGMMMMASGARADAPTATVKDRLKECAANLHCSWNEGSCLYYCDGGYSTRLFNAISPNQEEGASADYDGISVYCPGKFSDSWCFISLKNQVKAMQLLIDQLPN